jgi:hypothetical protein
MRLCSKPHTANSRCNACKILTPQKNTTFQATAFFGMCVCNRNYTYTYMETTEAIQSIIIHTYNGPQDTKNKLQFVSLEYFGILRDAIRSPSTQTVESNLQLSHECAENGQ